MKWRILAWCTWVLAFAVHAETLVIPGAGTSEVVLKHLAEGFQRQYPQDQVQIPPSVGSAGGIKAVAGDEAIIGQASRSLREREVQAGLKQLVFAQDAVAFAVGEAVTVHGLSCEQLADIYSGRIDNWSVLGGPSMPIRVLVRETTESSYEILRRAFPLLQNIKVLEQAKLANHDYEMIELLGKYKTAIGWMTSSSLPSARPGVKLLAIDGASPSLSAKYRTKFSKPTGNPGISRRG
jgi:phosphate transport system substrate-binding protein